MIRQIARIAPTMPKIILERIKGFLIKLFVAPTNFIVYIMNRLEYIIK